MALSDDELRTLEQMENALAQDDPRLASTLRGRPQFVVARRGASLGVIGLIAGLALLVLGVSTFFVVSLVGYVMMLVGALALLSSVHRVEAPPTPPADRPARTTLTNHDFVTMMEQQWRRQHPDL